MRKLHTPDLYIRLRHGGVLELSVCREDKIEIIRGVTRSLKLEPIFANQLFDICNAIDNQWSSDFQVAK